MRSCIARQPSPPAKRPEQAHHGQGWKGVLGPALGPALDPGAFDLCEERANLADKAEARRKRAVGRGLSALLRPVRSEDGLDRLEMPVGGQAQVDYFFGHIAYNAVVIISVNLINCLISGI